MTKRRKLPNMGKHEGGGKLAEFAASKDGGGAQLEASAVPTAAEPAPKPEMKKMTLALNRAAWVQFRVLCAEQDKSGQVLLVEAVNLLFKDCAKPQVA